MKDKKLYLDINNKPHYLEEDNRVTWRISGYACIFDDSGKILMTKTIYNDFFGVPGGGVDTLESIREGINRECVEELGCEIELESLSFYVDESQFYRSKENDFKHSINIFYRGKLVSDYKEIKTASEVISTAWVDIASLENSIVFNNLYGLIEYLKSKNYV